MKRAVILSALGLLLSAAPAVARSEIERTMAEELLRLTNVEGNLATMREQVIKMVDTQVETMDMEEKDKPRLAERTKKIMDLVFDELSWKQMKDQYIEVYVSVFTQEELGGLITFYRSPVGQAYINKMPALMKRSMELGQAKMERLGPRIHDMLEDLAKENEREDSSESEPK